MHLTTKLMKDDAPTSSASGSNPTRSQVNLDLQGEWGKGTVPSSLVELLMKSEELLTTYFKASNVGFCILDTEFRYIAVNEALARINRIPAGDHVGKSVRDIVGGFAEVVQPYLQKVVATGEPAADLELSFILPRRSDPGHWIIHYIPIKNADGKVTQIGAVVVEVTEQKKLEDSLRSVSDNLHLEKNGKKC